MSTSREIVMNAINGAVKIIIHENDVKKAGDIETCCSCTSSKIPQDAVAQTANDHAT